MQTDVIVIGGGLAGHCAALEASAAGASVLLLEKEADLGGSSVLSGGSFAFAGTEDQVEAGINDTPWLLERDFLSVGEHLNDPSLVRLYADYQLAAHAWLKARGVAFGPIQASSGQSVPRLHPANPREVIRLLSERLTQNEAITIRTNAPVARLLRAEVGGRVTGIRLADGEEIAAAHGVVLTSGGFSRSKEMIGLFAPQQLDALNVGGAGNVGDGIRMAWQLGAGVRDMPYIKGTFGNHPDARPDQHTACLAVYRGAIAVNRAGHRFANESISYKTLGDACLKQPGHVGFQIFDQPIFDTQERRVPIFDFTRRIEEGLMFSAATLEDLAGIVGVDPAALQDTVTRYNASVGKERDEDFGRDSLVQGFGAMRRIDTAPFYAYPSTSTIIATYAGVTVNDRLEVLDVFGTPIEGLYAAGEVTGGFHGAAFMTGTSLGKCVICGRLAGARAAA